MQMMELSLSDEPALRARLEQGVLAVRAKRDRAIQEGWAYKGERRALATRELQWEQALRQTARRIGNGRTGRGLLHRLLGRS
jgi:hypothetical protein